MRSVSARVGVGAAVAGTALTLGMYGSMSAAAAPNPPGNNGTIKIDGVAFDDLPNNEPHVGCDFQVDFYGYDEGDLEATVTFEAHPPTVPDSGSSTLLTDTVDIGEDDNSGGGSEAGLDASEEYSLSFAGMTAHPQQGYHVKLTIHAEGSQGADVKHKVFWVEGCETSTESPTESPTPTKTHTHKPTKTHTHTPTKTHTQSPAATTTSPAAEEECDEETDDECTVVGGQPGFTG